MINPERFKPDLKNPVVDNMMISIDFFSKIVYYYFTIISKDPIMFDIDGYQYKISLHEDAVTVDNINPPPENIVLSSKHILQCFAKIVTKYLQLISKYKKAKCCVVTTDIGNKYQVYLDKNGKIVVELL